MLKRWCWVWLVTAALGWYLIGKITDNYQIWWVANLRFVLQSSWLVPSTSNRMSFSQSFELFQMEFIWWYPGFFQKMFPWSLRFQCNFSRFSGTNKMRWLHSFPPCWTSVQHCQIVKMCRGLEIVHQPLRLRQSLEEGLRMTRISRYF